MPHVGLALIDRLITKMTLYYNTNVVWAFKRNGVLIIVVSAGSWPPRRTKDKRKITSWVIDIRPLPQLEMRWCGMLYGWRRRGLFKVLPPQDQEKQEMKKERRYTAVNRHSTVSKPLFLRSSLCTFSLLPPCRLTGQIWLCYIGGKISQLSTKSP